MARNLTTLRRWLRHLGSAEKWCIRVAEAELPLIKGDRLGFSDSRTGKERWNVA